MAEGKLRASLTIAGPPGAGKSTQARRLSSTYGLLYVSVTSALLDEITRRSSLGDSCADYLLQNSLPPDLVIQSVLDQLRNASTRPGFVLDGFPCTIQGALALDDFLAGSGWEVYSFVFLDVPDEVGTQRLLNRRVCPECGAVYSVYDAIAGEPETRSCPICRQYVPEREIELAEIQRRREVYRRYIGPVLGHYRETDALLTVDASGTVGETTRRIAEQAPGLEAERHA